MSGRKLSAAALVFGGVAWVTNGAVGLGAADGSGGFYASEVVWLVVHTFVLVGLIGLLRRTPDDDVMSRRGFAFAVAGRVGFLIAEVVAIAVGYDEIPLFPPVVVMTAAGMIVGGAGILRSRRWTGWGRFAPLVMGVYPVVAIIPIAAATGDRPNASVCLWGATIVALGAALLTAVPDAAPASAARTTPTAVSKAVPST
jgi:hypothetical protein